MLIQPYSGMIDCGGLRDNVLGDKLYEDYCWSAGILISFFFFILSSSLWFEGFCEVVIWELDRIESSKADRFETSLAKPHSRSSISDGRAKGTSDLRRFQRKSYWWKKESAILMAIINTDASKAKMMPSNTASKSRMIPSASRFRSCEPNLLS